MQKQRCGAMNKGHHLVFEPSTLHVTKLFESKNSRLVSTKLASPNAITLSSVGGPGVNLLVGMSRNKSDGALCHQLLDGPPCQRSGNLKLDPHINDKRYGDGHTG